MNSFLSHIRKNKIVYIVALFFIAKFLTIQSYRTVWWDAAVYIGMGKYIYSSGNAGFWEASRPIVWPLILGFLWKAGFNVVSLGRTAEIIFGSLCICLTYLIGRKIFDKKIALLSSLFLALSPTFFFFNGMMLTEIVSTFFSLLAIYLFIEKRYFTSGIFLGVAFMARFLQFFVFAALFLILIFNKKNAKNCPKLLLGFVVAAIPFLILNQILYNNPLFPFFQQIVLSRNSGWLNYHPLSYYFIGLFNENFLYLLSIFGIFVLFKDKDMNKRILMVIFSIFFIFFNSISQKEMRFLIILLPYMYLLMSYSIIHIFNSLKNKIFKSMLVGLVIFSFMFSLNATYAYYKNENNKNNQYTAFQNKLEEIGKGSIWVSNPVISAYSNKKTDRLMYYPIFNKANKEELIKESNKADFMFLDLCDLGCKPSDRQCENDKIELLAYFKQHLRTVYSSKAEQCEQFIFQR